MCTALIWHYPETIPPGQIRWLETILRQSYGLNTRPQASHTEYHTLTHPDSPKRLLIHSRPSCNDATLKPWTPDAHNKTEVELIEFHLPVIRGQLLANKEYVYREGASNIEIGVDIFATVFAILSGEEEHQPSQRDRYYRFSARFSRANKEGYLDRPIVDEYVEILWAYIHELWPFIKRKRRIGKIKYSCDVDVPFDPAARNFKEFTKRVAADLVKRKDLRAPIDRFTNLLKVRKGQVIQDPNYEFDFIFNQIKHLEQPAVFYFLSTLKISKGQGWYKINDSNIKRLIKQIIEHGHAIGLHGSFGSFRDSAQLAKERCLLEDVCKQVGAPLPITHNRQHYLQFDITSTPDILEANGITHDSSGSFAEFAGFRFGTAIPFPMWSWQEKRGLQLIQEPLVCMEASLLASNYMNLAHYPEAYNFATKLKQRALAYGGDFTLLWHNSHLKTEEDKALFSDLLRPIS